MNIRLERLYNEKGLGPEEKIKLVKDALYEVYEFDPLVLINMFHLQSSETLKNLSPKLLSDIKELSRSSFKSIAAIFEDGIREGKFIDRHPVALADVVWALFSGVVLWEESKRLINSRKDFLTSTLEIAFEILNHGIKACPEPSG